MEIRHARPADAAVTAAIYNHEVRNSTATFDLVPRTTIEQREWIEERSGALAVLVAEIEGAVAGFAAISPYRERPAYRTTVENSVYVHPEYQRQGVGKALLSELVGQARDHGFHAMVARVVSTHQASIALHEACGFQTVGLEREVGRKFGKWLDVAIMEVLL